MQEGLDRLHARQISDGVQERFEKLRTALEEKDKDLVGEVMGDFLFDLAGLARHWRLNAEDVLRRANQRFLEHFENKEKEQISCPGKKDRPPFGES